MREADVVLHYPTGEKWVLGGVDYERDEVYPLGWPETIAKASHCLLVERATDAESDKLINELANKSGYDVRVSHCRELLRKRHVLSEAACAAGS